MEDIDQSGNDEVNMSSVIANLFKQQLNVNIIRYQWVPNNCNFFFFFKKKKIFKRKGVRPALNVGGCPE